MLRALPCLALITCTLAATAQTQNALDFDGVDDRVTVANASGLLVGGSGISMSCWFYPRNAVPGFPDFDGIAGFRNENDFDFYILQLTGTSVEARIRFGFTDVYTIEGGGVQLNTWNHAALVHDGTTLTLYINGVLSSSASAPGTVLNTTSPFQIGNLTYQINEFTMNGRADEIGLWKRAITEAEIACLLNGSADLTDPDLVLFYGCDQGTAGGDNTAITSLTDATGTMDGEFIGLALNGAGSNFVAGAGIGTSLNANVCPGGSYIHEGDPLPAGIYTFSYTGQSGCDSVVTVTVTEIPVNISVNATATTLTSLNGGAQWQWLDCDNGYAEIAGATFQTFTPTGNGGYAVEVSVNGCVDTSACYDMTSIGIEERLAQISARLFPTVTSGTLRLLLDAPQGTLNVAISDALGRIVQRSQAPAKAEQWLDVAALNAGSYSLLATSNGQSRVLRFEKE